MTRFLVVDDDPASRRLLTRLLSPYGSCDQAAGGPEALHAFEASLAEGRPYDLVCLDIMMPGTDGHAVLRALRALEQAHGLFGSDGTKVVMITALSDPKHCIRAFGEGCESYITKPIFEDRLLAEVRSQLGGLPEKEQQPADRAATPAGRRFLIVDDDRLCRELLKSILCDYGQCDFAYDGQEAIDAVRLAIEDADPYDLICLDIMMPGTDGHQALDAIRQIEAGHGIYGNDGVKVIMTTALSNSRHCLRAFREGCEA